MAIHAVTGGFGYSGRAILQRLLDRGVETRTLTNSGNRPDPFGGRVAVYPLCFEDAARLEDSLRGVSVLYNTYWVRFNHRSFSFQEAVRNTKVLFEAARRAGVRRIVHVSILNPERGGAMAYYRGKAELERALRGLGLSHAILRPGVLFGRGDILVNNIAWVLRRLPLFGVFGDGSYRLAPMHVDDFADLAVEHGARDDHSVIDAAGPQTFTYRELVERIGAAIGVRGRIVSVSPRVGYALARAIGPLVGDVVVTREEIEGLMAGLLASEQAGLGRICLTDWAIRNRATLGRRYASELGRRRRTGRSQAGAAWDEISSQGLDVEAADHAACDASGLCERTANGHGLRTR